MLAPDTLAFGLDLRLTTTEEGGRRTPLLGGSEEPHFQYRPNWGLPGWPDGQQTGAPVFGFADSDIHPGQVTWAVIVAMFPDQVPDWATVVVGSELRMYEGLRICGLAQVRWIRPATWRMKNKEAEHYLEWLSAR